jgi:hypothetical protein
MSCKHSIPPEGAQAFAITLTPAFHNCVFCDLDAARADRDRLTAEVDRLTLLADAWRKILDEVEYEARRKAICRTCSSAECQIRELCTSATACRSLYRIAFQSEPAALPPTGAP